MTRNDVIMISPPKQWENADIREISQIIYYSKGLDESYPKLQVLSSSRDFVKSNGYLSKLLAFLPQALTKYG